MAKVRIEVVPEQEEDVVLFCKALTPAILELKERLQRSELKPREMLVTLQGAEYILPFSDILFFESDGGKTAVHTKSRMYYTDLSLAALSERLTGDFFRGSKSCIVNLRRIASLHRELTGVCEVRFQGCDKNIFVSRMYYKAFRERLDAIRLGGQKED